MSPLLTLITALIGGAAQLLEAQKNKQAQEVGEYAGEIDQVLVAVLQKSAEVKGLSIDWTDPTAIAGYVATLPTFQPLAAPAPAPTPIVQDKPATS